MKCPGRYRKVECHSFRRPAADIGKVSLVGRPCHGESVIVHLVDGQRVVAASCVDENFQGFSRSAGLAYLNGIEVDFADNVSCVLATRWHNDHTSDLSEMVDFRRSATFCRADSFSGKEFLGFASSYAPADPTPNARSTSGIAKVFELLAERDTNDILVCRTLAIASRRKDETHTRFHLYWPKSRNFDWFCP